MLNSYSYTIAELLEAGVPIFDFSYPLYVDELDIPDSTKYTLRKQFERYWLHHYMYNQIGFPTVKQFKHFLEDTFRIEMPYINELFKLSSLEYDPLYAYYLKEHSDILSEEQRTSKETSSGRNEAISESEFEGSENSNSTSERRFLDTPENDLQNFFDGKYLTDISNTTNDASGSNSGNNITESTGTSSGTFDGDYSEDNMRTLDRTLLGNIGNLSAGEILLKTAKSKEFFLHTMSELFARCDDLFMLIY